MKYEVDGWNNFCRVFEVPNEFKKGFCFGGGIPTNFQMVDWFNPVADVHMSACPKEAWLKEVGEIETKEVTLNALIEILDPFIKKKPYRKPDHDYLVMCNFGAVFIVEKAKEYR